MFWSKEDHRLHQPNYYNNFQIVQHQNGIQQATAALPPHQQQQHHHHSTPPPQMQQQQQQLQQQQQQQQQHPQQGHRPTQHMSTHFPSNQQMQHQHHPPQWATRPPPILTTSPFFQHFPAPVPSTAQYCAAPPQYFHPQRVTQPPGVAPPSQQRPLLPTGCAIYPTLRQNVLSQPPAALMTPTPSSTAQQMQVQYFSAAQYCQPPMGQPAYGHVITPTVTETLMVKPRRHAIPIIDPDTQENILERELRRSECASPADVLSMATSSSSDLRESTNDWEVVQPSHHQQRQLQSQQQQQQLQQKPQYPQQPQRQLPQQQHHSLHQLVHQREMSTANTNAVPTITEKALPDEDTEKEKNEQEEEAMTEQSVDGSQPATQVDHVESIEADEELESTLTDEENQSKNDHSGETTNQTTQATDTSTQTTTNSPITTTPNSSDSAVTTPVTNDYEVESSKCSDTDKETASVAEINPPAVIEIVDKPSASNQKSAAEAAKPNKQPQQQQQQTRKQQHQPPPPTTKTTSKKSKKNSKRLKEMQKKQQKAELLSIESNNNNTLRTTNKCETAKSKQIVSSSEPSSRGTSKAKATANNSNTCADAGAANKSSDDLDRNSESDPTKKITAVTAAPSTVKDDTDQDTQSDADDSKSMKYKQIIEILSIESNENNELLFLNSSVSGYEDDICSSPAELETSACDKTKDILFGDFSQENPAQEISVQDDNESLDEVDDADDSLASNPRDGKKLSYTMQQLKNLANNPDSKIPPKFKGTVCGIIMKNHRGGASSSNMQPAAGQQNQMFQQLSYKDSMSYVNRNRNKHVSQQMKQQQQQQQRNPNIIRINLSLNEEIQLAKSENAWIPADLQKWGPKTDSDNDEQILKKIRSILNKLTPENFSKLLENATKFQITGEECMKKIMLLIFEKTISEPNFAPTYARFCKSLFNQDHPNHSMFKANLVKRIWEEFDSNVNNAKAKTAKLKPLMDKLAAATDPKEKLELKAELDDQEYQFRRRAWGTVRFIGEMCKLGFIDTDRVCFCIDNLLDRNCEEKVEYMCKLLTTVGAHLEPLDNKQRANAEKNKMDAIFTTIRQFVMEKKKGVGPKISSRVRFMMQDVLELRLRHWDQKPVSILPSREVSPMFTAHVQPQRNVRMGGGGGGGGGNYMSSSGYDKRRQGGDGQKNSSQQNIDVNKLLPLFNKDETTRKLGNSSQLLFKTTGRPQQQQYQQSPLPTVQPSDRQKSGSLESEAKESQSAQPIEFTNSECKRLLNGLIELAIEEEDKKCWFEKWEEISPAHHTQIIYYLLAEFIHTKQMNSPKEINACIRLFTSLMRETHLTRHSFAKGYEKFAQICDEILVDVPKCWQYVFNLLGPLLYHKLISFDMVWYEQWFDTPTGEKFLQSMIVQFTTEFGANYMRFFWEHNSLQWNRFIADRKVSTFIRNNRFEFIEKDEKPPMFIKRSADELVQRISRHLGQSDQDIPLIIDFINTNVNIDSKFINTLTMFLCDYTVIYWFTPDSSSICSYSSKEINLSDSLPSAGLCSPLSSRLEKFLKCIPLLRRCIDCKDEHEFACLDAILEICNKLCKSQNEDLISRMLIELYVADVISKESFEKWQQKLRAEGNNKLTKELDAFFKKLSIY